NNRSTANPACDTTPSPSAVTTNPRDQPLPFTWKVLLDLGPIRIFDNPYRPSSGALSAVDTPTNHGQPATPGAKSGLDARRPQLCGSGRQPGGSFDDRLSDQAESWRLIRVARQMASSPTPTPRGSPTALKMWSVRSFWVDLIR